MPEGSITLPAGTGSNPETFRRVLRRAAVSALLGGVLAFTSCVSRTETVGVAVAANFAQPAREIAELFDQATGYDTVLSFGSTGQLFAQITQDAPFEVFLAADRQAPVRTITAGLGIEDSVFTYAIGRIVLFSVNLDLTAGEDVLRRGSFARIAIANPVTAPYGMAALEVMESLGVYAALSGKIVRGNNIAQTFQFVETGNAELGFVAGSQVAGRNTPSVWVVPDNLYSPILQDAVLLRRGGENPGARAFVDFLKSAEAIRVIEKYGYQVP